MAKMFYTTEEAAQKLAISSDQLKQLVTENKLREFRDGARVMFKVDQVDKLVTDRKGGSSLGTKAGSSIGLGDSGISLAGDSHASDVISLADSTLSQAKDDTVVTGGAKGGSTRAGSKSGGQQVFKPGEVKSSDTQAQTHIQSAIDDQLSLEGVGSGSGLLDLTRESDDTSLGAELLDEIYPGGDSKGESGIGSASGIFVETAGGSGAAAAQGSADISVPSSSSSPVVVADISEVYDGSSGAFGGLALASALISVVTAVIALCFYNGFNPGWVQTITQNTMYVMIFGVSLVVLAVIFAGIGMVVAKPAR